jgi:hypothetical protein
VNDVRAGLELGNTEELTEHEKELLKYIDDRTWLFFVYSVVGVIGLIVLSLAALLT